MLQTRQKKKKCVKMTIPSKFWTQIATAISVKNNHNMTSFFFTYYSALLGSRMKSVYNIDSLFNHLCCRDKTSHQTKKQQKNQSSKQKRTRTQRTTHLKLHKTTRAQNLNVESTHVYKPSWSAL